MAGMSFGGGLAATGMDQQRMATGMLGDAAAQEAQRNEEDKRREAERKAGNQQLGATVGTMAGMAAGAAYGSGAGPYGALIGGLVGAIAGNYFAIALAVTLVVSMWLVPSTTEASTMTINTKSDITQMELHQHLIYDPGTGMFTWIAPRAARMKPGDRAGMVKKGDGYRCIKFGSKAYQEHRLAWLYMTGEWPAFEIDHINGDRSDNRFSNLRPVTRKQNCENRAARAGSASGFRGVSWSGGKWCAVIMHFGEQKMLGAFNDIEEAKAARLKAEKELFTHSERELRG